MKSAVLGVACLVCWAALDGCSRKQPPEQQVTSASAPAEKVPAHKPPLTKVKPPATTSKAQTRPTATESARSAERTKYVDSVEAKIDELNDKTQVLVATTKEMSPEQESQFAVLLDAFEAKCDEACRALDELDAASEGQWRDKKPAVERAMIELENACKRMSLFVRSAARSASTQGQ